MPIANGKIVEIGYVVDDLDDAIQFFSTTMAAGPFTVFEHVKMQGARYRGTPTDVDIDIALGASGGVVLELIRQRNAAPSPFHRSTSGVAFAPNHWSVFTHDFDGELQRYMDRGFEAVFYAEFVEEGTAEVARVVYLDTMQQAGTYLELMESDPPILLDLYRGIVGTVR